MFVSFATWEAIFSCKTGQALCQERMQSYNSAGCKQTVLQQSFRQKECPCTVVHIYLCSPRNSRVLVMCQSLPQSCSCAVVLQLQNFGRADPLTSAWFLFSRFLHVSSSSASLCASSRHKPSNQKRLCMQMRQAHEQSRYL